MGAQGGNKRFEGGDLKGKNRLGIPLRRSTIRIKTSTAATVVIAPSVATHVGAASSGPRPVRIIPAGVCMHLVNLLGPLDLTAGHPGIVPQFNQVLQNSHNGASVTSVTIFLQAHRLQYPTNVAKSGALMYASKKTHCQHMVRHRV